MFGMSGGKGCMYIKDCFTPIFPLLLMRLLRKLKLLLPMADVPLPHLLVLLTELAYARMSQLSLPVPF
jgi:hypothetical protein